MAIRKIRIYGDPLLRRLSEPVETIDAEIRELADDMIETMYAFDGVGLAAPQVGVLKQLFVMDSGEENGKGALVYLNPVISHSSGLIEMEEGCLSIPKIRADVKRAESFDFEAINLEGETIRFRAEGLVARVILHETDHLFGRLFVDLVSPVTKMMIKSQLKELVKQSRLVDREAVSMK